VNLLVNAIADEETDNGDAYYFQAKTAHSKADGFSGNVWESNPAIHREMDADGFEDREGHQCPIRPHKHARCLRNLHSGRIAEDFNPARHFHRNLRH